MEEASEFFSRLLAAEASSADLESPRLRVLLAEQIEIGDGLSLGGGAPAEIYMLRHHRHYKAGDVFFAFCSDPREPSRLRLLGARRHPADLLLMATYELCRDCGAIGPGRGAAGGEVCDACGGSHWRHLDGMPLIPPGALVAERVLSLPANAHHAAALRA